MTVDMSPDAFMQAVPALPGGNTAWAARYGTELREIIVRQAHRSPRNQQVHLGPSELGALCDRKVVGKLAGEPVTNHVADPWPSVVGTAVHAWLAEHFALENTLTGTLRWVPEQRVSPHPSYPGTADLYDAAEQCVVDHKILGPTSMNKVKSPGGPPRDYQVQLLLYAAGYRNLGLPVRRVALAAYPRTAATLDGMYVWEHACSADDDQLIDQVLAQTELRRQVAQAVMAGEISIAQVPRTPGPDACYFCSQFRPQAAEEIRRTGYQEGPGCPGHSLPY